MAETRKYEHEKGKKVVIFGKFNCQSFPLNDNAIFVSYEDLEQIGKTKCFDVENNCVIDYDNTEDVETESRQSRINELKQLLKKTDYQAIKFAEGQITLEEYEPMKLQRQAWRDEINELENKN